MILVYESHMNHGKKKKPLTFHYTRLLIGIQVTSFPPKFPGPSARSGSAVWFGHLVLGDGFIPPKMTYTPG